MLNILIRVDASIEIGAGHFVRQLAVAQLLIDEGFDIYFLTNATHKDLLDQAVEEGIKIKMLENSISIEADAKETADYAKK